MRDRERRLRRVTTRMTGRQRVAALLAAGRDSTVLPDDIGRGLTPAGWAAFHRDCARLDQLNVDAPGWPSCWGSSWTTRSTTGPPVAAQAGPPTGTSTGRCAESRGCWGACGA